MTRVHSSLYSIAFSLLASAYAASAGAVGMLSDSPRYVLPSVDFADMVVLDDAAVLQLTQDLTSLGAVQVKPIIFFEL